MQSNHLIFNLKSGDYINAVFVDGFTSARENIVTEWPMSNTVANFWAMVYDFDITAVVVLNPTSGPKASLGTQNFGKNIDNFILFHIAFLSLISAVAQ